MYLFTMLDGMGKRPHMYEYISPSFVVLVSVVVKNTKCFCSFIPGLYLVVYLWFVEFLVFP